MKVRLPLTCLLAAGTLACAPASSERSASPPVASVASAPTPVAAHPVDFATQIQPILKSHCQPCHFEGGQMYERLPFDKGETVVGLGERMFTRIKDEGEQKTIREFLAQEGKEFSK